MYRIGNGFDVHRFEKGKKLILGGVEINFEYGLKAHSDGDVLIHSIIDSILGASAMGDIGTHFPDTDEEFKNINSKILLEKILKKIENKYKIVNIDSTIVCEKPNLKAYKEAIRENIAKMCNVDISQISIKAKTMEQMGAIGREEGIAVITSTLLLQKD